MPNVLNFGSLNLDFVYSVDHFVQPGETIASNDLSLFLGGKGLNQSIALAKAGTTVYHAGCIGMDGILLKDTLKSNHVNTDFVFTSDKKTGHAIIQVDKYSQNCIILYGGANQTINNTIVQNVFSHFDENTILLLQNEISFMPEIMETAAKKGMKIAFNPSPFDSNILSYPLDTVHWFMINEVEGKQLTGYSDPDQICRFILNQYPDTAVVLTLGKFGVLYEDANTRLTYPIFDVPVIDTTAAGDTFTGYFLSSIIAGRAIQQSLEIASAASSIAVSRKGSSISIPTIEEVRKFLSLKKGIESFT